MFETVDGTTLTTSLTVHGNITADNLVAVASQIKGLMGTVQALVARTNNLEEQLQRATVRVESLEVQNAEMQRNQTTIHAHLAGQRHNQSSLTARTTALEQQVERLAAGTDRNVTRLAVQTNESVLGLWAGLTEVQEQVQGEKANRTSGLVRAEAAFLNLSKTVSGIAMGLTLAELNNASLIQRLRRSGPFIVRLAGFQAENVTGVLAHSHSVTYGTGRVALCYIPSERNSCHGQSAPTTSFFRFEDDPRQPYQACQMLEWSLASGLSLKGDLPLASLISPSKIEVLDSGFYNILLRVTLLTGWGSLRFDQGYFDGQLRIAIRDTSPARFWRTISCKPKSGECAVRPCVTQGLCSHQTYLTRGTQIAVQYPDLYVYNDEEDGWNLRYVQRPASFIFHNYSMDTTLMLDQLSAVNDDFQEPFFFGHDGPFYFQSSGTWEITQSQESP